MSARVRLSNGDLAELRKLLAARQAVPKHSHLHTYVGIRIEHLQALLDELDERRLSERYFPDEAPTAEMAFVPPEA